MEIESPIRRIFGASGERAVGAWHLEGWGWGDGVWGWGGGTGVGGVGGGVGGT